MLSAIRASKVDLVLLAVAIVWGASYLSAKAITPFATVPAMLSVRFGIAITRRQARSERPTGGVAR